MEYRAIVLSVLLYGAETWILKAEHARCVSTYSTSVRAILGVTRYHQWQLRLIPNGLANRFGKDWSIPDIIMNS